MVINTVDGKMLQKMFLAGAKNIEAKKEYINELNVFPVPDGDTGTNMTLTIMSAAKEVGAIDNPTIENLSKAISSGSLRGARGNSGVILSQLFRGFTKEVADKKEINVALAAKAFEHAVETAYNAVMKPKEGTILTVARGGATKALILAEETDDLVYFLDEVLRYMEEVLNQTPDMLPVLKEAGVVDSGGEGLITILRGAYDALLGKEIDLSSIPVASRNSAPVKMDSNELSTAHIKFGYCTEFIVMLEKEYTTKTELAFKSFLESIGDSIVVVSDDDIVKVHVHTNDPGLAIQRALTYGSLTSMKIDNMREEHNEKVIKDAEREALKAKEAKSESPRKEVGFISVSIGEGINGIFSGLGVDYLIEGGQTMNPSTEDMLEAITKVNADTIFILPNNKNIILAAEQAKNLTEDKNIIVIPSKTIPQGITAIINYVFDKTPEENAEHMTNEMRQVKTGQVTYAVRDTSIDGKMIATGDIMGIADVGILSVGKDISVTTMQLVDELVDADSELLSLYYGDDVEEVTANAMAKSIMDKYPDVDVETHFGGQPIYYYVLSVE
ncbi:MAG: DAK2 domain-containing protein [Velocimicrobium sp.]